MVESTGALVVWFFFAFFSIAIGASTAIHLLLTAEVLWVTLFAVSLLVGLIYDNTAVLSLTFFFLVFSAIELGVGLALALLQNAVLRTTALHEGDANFLKFFYRLRSRLYAGRLNWKL